MLGSLIMPGRDPLAIFSRFARDYGDIAFFRMSGERVYFINHPDYIRQVLVVDQAKYAKSRALERARKLLGGGLLTVDGADHQRKRRLVQPAFHRAQVQGYAETMIAHARRMSDRWTAGTTIDMSAEMMRLTLGIVARTLFDVDIELEADSVGAALTDVLETFWLTLLPFSDLVEAMPLRALKRSAGARARLDALIYQMIADRRRRGGERHDVLSMLIGSDGDGTTPRLSDQEIRDEVLTLLLAGHETTANALVWTFYLLSGAPEVGVRLRAEIDRVLAGRPPSAGDFDALPYASSVVTESMRLFPPAWTIGRRAKVAAELAGYAVPPGAMVFMSPWTMHRDARFYADPERFLPERWTAEFKASLPKHAYFPFGGGPRTCIGEAFAWMELVLVVATIAGRWDLRLLPGHPVKVQPLLTLRARHGMRMTPQPRQ
jgi:cytochrome P450